MSRRLRIGLSALCAVVAVVACSLYVGGVRDEARRAEAEAMRRYGGETVTLLVSTRSLAAGEVLSAADVEPREWVSTLAPEGALLADEDVMGREVGVPVAANAPLCELNFCDDDQMAEIPSGHVAVSVPMTDQLGMAAGVTTGSRVVPYRVADGSAEPIGSVAVVLATPGASRLAAGSVTVAVRAQDVPAVLAASTDGELRIVVPASDVKSFPSSVAESKNVDPVPSARRASSGEGPDPAADSADKGESPDVDPAGERADDE